MLACNLCLEPHDFDLAPDIGECAHCGGPLVEVPGELVHTPASAITQAVTDGTERLRRLTNRVPRARN